MNRPPQRRSPSGSNPARGPIWVRRGTISTVSSVCTGIPSGRNGRAIPSPVGPPTTTSSSEQRGARRPPRRVGRMHGVSRFRTESSVLPVLVALVTAVVLAAPGCRGKEDVIAGDERGTAVDHASEPVAESTNSHILSEQASWQLDTGHEQVDGAVAYVSEGGGRITLQLVNEDAINLILVIVGNETREGEVEAAFLAFGRGKRCSYPFENAPSFTARLDRLDAQSITGVYDGMMQCDDQSTALRARGTFRVSRTG